MVLFAVFYVIAFFGLTLAFLFGGRAERQGGLILVVMTCITAIYAPLFSDHYSSLNLFALCDDLVGLIGFSLIGIFSKRIWPLWAAAFQLLSVGAHFVKSLDIPVRPIVYAWMKTGPTWAVLILLLIGTLANHRLERR